MSDDIKGPTPGITGEIATEQAIDESIVKSTPEIDKSRQYLSVTFGEQEAIREQSEYRADIRAALTGMISSDLEMKINDDDLVYCAIAHADEIRRQLAARKGAV